MNNIKWLIVLAAFVLIAFNSNSRYLGPGGGISAQSADLGVHLAISDYVRNLDFFPYLHSQTIGKHGVSKYLPIYHGILGFHVTAAGLELIGVPILGAYQLIVDLSILAVILFLVFYFLDQSSRHDFLWKLPFLLLCLAGYLVYADLALNYAFLSQLYSQGLFAGFSYLYYKKYYRVSFALLLMSCFAYPEVLIWLGPFIILKKISTPFLRLPVFTIWIGIATIPFLRISLAGPTAAALIFPACVLLISMMFFKRLKKREELLWISLTFAIYITAISIHSFKFGDVSYYAGKLSAFAYLLLPILFLEVVDLKALWGKVTTGAFAVLLIQSFYTEPSRLPNLLWTYPALKNAELAPIAEITYELKKDIGCTQKNTYLFPSKEHDRYYSTKFLSLHSSDLYAGYPNSVYLRKNFKEDSSLIIFFTQNSGPSIVSQLAQGIRDSQTQPDFCLAVPDTQASLFTNSPVFEKISTGEHFVYFKSKKER